MPEHEELLTTAGLAAALKLNEKTVREWAKAGKIPEIRLGQNTVRYRLGEVLAALGRRGERDGPAS